jgi:imidazolonepropionase-like amidohydrolase
VIPSADYRPTAGARIIDARGKYLIPGLWDMHVHIAGISADPKWSKSVILPLLIAQGVTGVRDMGGDLGALHAWKQEIEAGKLLGPHIFAGGPMIVPSGKKTAEQWPVRSPEEARAAVRELNTYSSDKAVALWATFKKNGTWVTPTLVSIEVQTPQAKTPEEQSSDPRLQFVPASLRKEWDPLDPKNRVSESDQKWWANQYANDMRLTAAMHKAGVSVLAGSDSLDRFVFPGFALHQELALLNQQGLTPLEALQAATSDAAKFLGHQGEFGVIANGAHADLVLLDENPLEKISNTTRIAAVIRDDVYLDRTALDKLLSQAKDAAKAASIN